MNKEQLIKHLIFSGVLKTPEIIDAFKKIDRADFILPELIDQAYEDYPLKTKERQTISQPSTVAFMLELLSPQKNEKILDVGSGSGWTTALLAAIVGKKGKVWGMEIVDELVSFGQKNLAKYEFANAKIQKAGGGLGLTDSAPFDKILVSAAANNLPQELVNQLKIGGIMVIPIGNSVWKIRRISKEKIEKEEYFGFVFVPLKSI